MQHSRRSLLGHALLLPASAAATPAAPDWSKIRGEFLLRPGLLYFNAANIAPAPRSVLHEYQRQVDDFHSDPSFQNREQYKSMAEQVRKQLAALLHTRPDEIAITRNTSEGNNLVAQGLGLRSGDEVLITSHNHESNTESWNLRAQQRGASVVVAPVPVQAKTPSEILDSVARRVTARTRVIAVSHLTNTTGLPYPVRELASLARRSGAWLHVDGAQTFGWMNLNLPALGMDSFTGSMSKWPMGPLESGVLYIRKERLEEVSPAVLSHNYWAEESSAARKFEQLGQRDDPRLAAMVHTLNFHNRLGPAPIEKRTLALATRLRAALTTVPGVDVRGSGEAAVSGPVIKVNFPKRDLDELNQVLWSRHRIAIAATLSGESSGLRFSPHIYNSESEIDAAVSALKKV